jgi:hypothetical protein
MSKPTKSETLHNDVSVITSVLATFNVKRKPWAKEQSYVPLQLLYVNCEKWEYELRYNIFQKLVRKIPIVVSGIKLP